MTEGLSLAATAERRFCLRADSADVVDAAAWLQQAGAECGVPEASLTRLDHCQDEALANVIMHGGESARAAPIQLWLDVRQDAQGYTARLTVSDAGMAFNPLAAQQKQRPVSLDDAEPGGLGILLMRSNADDIQYRFDAGRNHLSFIVRWREPT